MGRNCVRALQGESPSPSLHHQMRGDGNQINQGFKQLDGTSEKVLPERLSNLDTHSVYNGRPPPGINMPTVTPSSSKSVRHRWESADDVQLAAPVR